VQEPGEEHDTPVNADPVDPTGFGVIWTDQVAPFHRSASVTLPMPVLRALPTAVQEPEEEHDTPSKPAAPAPTGFGVVWTDQVAPFHRSASGSDPPLALAAPPTAVHAVAEVHDTPLRVDALAPTGTRVDWIAQVTPFHRSARGVSSTALYVYPTAMHVVVREHDTLFRNDPLAPTGFGDDSSAQVTPFHRSAKVAPTTLSLEEYPMAVHAVDEVHDTPLRIDTDAPTGFWVCWTAQDRPFQRSASVTTVPSDLR
jgi:hypothetical protein